MCKLQPISTNQHTVEDSFSFAVLGKMNTLNMTTKQCAVWTPLLYLWMCLLITQYMSVSTSCTVFLMPRNYLVILQNLLLGIFHEKPIYIIMPTLYVVLWRKVSNDKRQICWCHIHHIWQQKKLLMRFHVIQIKFPVEF